MNMMDARLNLLMQAIKENYYTFNYSEWQNEEMRNGVYFIKGKKYIKIVSRNSVWGFIVNTENDTKFLYGDILKPASWKAPARNFARGNVFNDAAFEKISWASA